MADRVDEQEAVRVGFRYQDGEVLSAERQVSSFDDELPEVVIDVGGEWLTLPEVRDAAFAALEDSDG